MLDAFWQKFDAILQKLSGEPRRRRPDRRFRPQVEKLGPRIVPTGTLEFLQAPSQAVAGIIISSPIKVGIFDASGALNTIANDQIYLTNSGLEGGTYGTNVVDAVNGIATFGNIYFSPPETSQVLLAYDLSSGGASSPATSNPFPVAPAATATSVTVTPSASTFGDVVTLTATVDRVAPAGGTFGDASWLRPDGFVQFLVNGTSLVTVSVSVNPAAHQAIATWITSTLPAGSDTIEAVYPGDISFSGSSATTTLVVANTPPTLLNPLNRTNYQGDAVSLPLLGSDPDGDSLSYSIVGLLPGLGLNSSTGLITGTVTAGAGSYNVVATVTDSSGLSTSQSFTWTVIGTNTPPTLLNPGNQTSNEGATVSLPLQGSDADGDTLSYSIVGLLPGLGFNSSSGLISGTLTASPGQYTITATVTDSYGYSATQTFTWTVVDLPPVAIDQSYTGTEDQSLAVAAANGLLTGDSDPQGSPLTAQVDSGPANGQLTENPDGSFTYTPNTGFVGTDSFTYWAVDADGEKSNVAVAQLVVQAEQLKVGPQTEGPTAVPGNSIYQFRIRFYGSGFDSNLIPLSAVTWHSSDAVATYVDGSKGRVFYTNGPNRGKVDGVLGSFQFSNTPKELTIWVDYTLDGAKYESKPITVDDVQVTISTPQGAQQATRETGPFAAGAAFYTGTPSVFPGRSRFKIDGANFTVQGVHVAAENPQQRPISRHGLEYRAFVTLVGPTVNGVANKGVADIRVGFVQHITVNQLTGLYPTNPAKKLVSTLTGKTFLDSEQGAAPWQTRDPIATFFNPTAARNSTVISYRDAPHLGAPEVYLGARISEIQILTSFTLDVVAETIDDHPGKADERYFREATAAWSFNGTALFDWTKNPPSSLVAGAGINAPNVWNTNIPAPVAESTDGPTFNSLLDPLKFKSENG